MLGSRTSALLRSETRRTTHVLPRALAPLRQAATNMAIISRPRCRCDTHAWLGQSRNVIISKRRSKGCNDTEALSRSYDPGNDKTGRDVAS